MKKITGLLLIACLSLSFIVFLPNIALAFLGWAGANNSPYIPTTNTQPYDINVSRNAGQSKKPCIAIDSNDIPHIVWEDNHGAKFGNYDIMYVRWDPTIDNWVGANGSVYDPTVDVTDQPHDINVSQNLKNSITPKIVLDSNDIPHIVWSDYTGNDSDIFYVYWDPGLPSGPNWARADHTLYNGSNADVSLNTGDSCHPDIDLDSNDMPHIAWADTHYGDPEILYVHWDDSMVGQQWVCADGSRYMANGPFCHGNVSDNDGNSLEPSIKVEDGPNFASIAWADNSYTTSRTKNYEILYVSWDGSQWIGANGSAYNPATGANANVSSNVGDSRAPSLELGVDPAFPHIAWHDETCTVGIKEILYVRFTGVNWVGANGGIYNSTTCANALVSDSSADAKHPKLVLDSNSQPHLVWYVNTNDGVTDII